MTDERYQFLSDKLLVLIWYTFYQFTCITF